MHHTHLRHNFYLPKTKQLKPVRLIIIQSKANHMCAVYGNRTKFDISPKPIATSFISSTTSREYYFQLCGLSQNGTCVYGWGVGFGKSWFGTTIVFSGSVKF